VAFSHCQPPEDCKIYWKSVIANISGQLAVEFGGFQPPGDLQVWWKLMVSMITCEKSAEFNGIQPLLTNGKL
jgi:hypothetical protein